MMSILSKAIKTILSAFLIFGLYWIGLETVSFIIVIAVDAIKGLFA